MALTKIQGQNIANSAISTNKVDAAFTATYATYAAVAANLTPRITTVNVANSAYTVLDDTAVNTAGGFLVITGSNFQSGAIVTIDTTQATSTTFVNSTTLRAQTAARNAGSYTVYVQNPDGGTAIRVNGVTFSNTPIWGTAAALSNQAANTAFAVNISASSDSAVTYSNTTALPAGTTLLANGLFYGTVTVGAETVYSFDVRATDAENQDTPRTFSLTVTVGPPAGTLWGWGLNDYSIYSLGLNDMGSNRSSPVQIGSGSDWQTVEADMNYVFAIKSDGTLWSWGDATNGETGLSSTIFKSSPTQVGSATNWKTVTTGRYHAGAIKTNGTLWTWGYNNNGQLGLNTMGAYAHRSSPTQVGSDTNWDKLACQQGSTIAIKTDGTIWSWGNAADGRLGLNNDATAKSSPTQIGADTTWSNVSAVKSNQSVFALKTNGTLWCWGNNSSIQGILGLNDFNVNRSSPTQIGSATTWSVIAETNDYNMFAIKTDGTLWSWGQNDQGSLGINNRLKTSSPTQVGTGTDWSKVSVGAQHSMLLKTNGTLWLIGRNSYGQLGLNTAGDPENRSSPVQIGSSTNWIDIIAGGYNSFARRSV